MDHFSCVGKIHTISGHDTHCVGSAFTPGSRPELQLFFSERGPGDRVGIRERTRTVAFIGSQYNTGSSIYKRHWTSSDSKPVASVVPKLPISNRQFEGH